MIKLNRRNSKQANNRLKSKKNSHNLESMIVLKFKIMIYVNVMIKMINTVYLVLNFHPFSKILNNNKTNNGVLKVQIQMETISKHRIMSANQIKHCPKLMLKRIPMFKMYIQCMALKILWVMINNLLVMSMILMKR